MINILLCEQNKAWQENFSSKLEDNMTLAGVVPTGKEAQKVMIQDKVDVLVLNIETKSFSFFEVVKFVKQKFPRIVIIMLVDDGVNLDDYFYSDKEITKLGVSEVYVKPFPILKLIKFITQSFMHEAWKDVVSGGSEGTAGSSPSDEDETELSEPDRKFTSLQMDKFQHNNVAIFDLYVRLSKNKYIKVFNIGAKISAQRLAKYIEKDAGFRLYFKTGDRLSYINYINELIERRLSRETMSSIETIKAVESSSKMYIEEIYTNGLPEHVMQQSMNVCNNMYASVQRNTDLKKLLDGYLQEGDTESAHVFLTAFYTAITSENIEWVTSHSRTKLIFGALLHDIGKVKLPNKIRNANVNTLDGKDLEIYQKHPEYGVELLDAIEGISEQVKQIVYQHHELNNGGGFPSKLPGSKIYPLAKIVGFAEFLAVKSLSYTLSPFDTIKKVIEERDEIMNYEPFVIKAFLKGFVKNVE